MSRFRVYLSLVIAVPSMIFCGVTLFDRITGINLRTDVEGRSEGVWNEIIGTAGKPDTMGQRGETTRSDRGDSVVTASFVYANESEKIQAILVTFTTTSFKRNNGLGNGD